MPQSVKGALSDSHRLHILNTPWTAPEGFVWPCSSKKEGDKTRLKYLGQQHFRGSYSCFEYSLAKKGIFCKPCVLFAPESVRGIQLKSLVKTPLSNYCKLTGKDGALSSHISKSFHEDSMTRAIGLKSGVHVGEEINKAASEERRKNRAALSRILQAVEYHGRLGLSLRGHRDSGNLPIVFSEGSTDIDYTQGNLRACLQLMVACNDEVLRRHIDGCPLHASYISPKSQNELIDAIGQVMQQEVVLEWKQSQYFSLIADETTDFSKREQLSVCLRYVLPNNSIRERFLSFEIATDLTGLGLATQLLSLLDRCGIDITRMVGQGYDGAAAMSGEKNGVQKHIRDQCPAALYVHCAAHSLNLCLMKASEVPEIRAAVTLLQDIAVFYSDSNKRLLDLQSCIDDRCPDSNRSKLKKYCATRWVEKQQSVMTFRLLYPAVLLSLEHISTWRNDSSGKAMVYLKALDGSFLVSLEVLSTILEVA